MTWKSITLEEIEITKQVIRWIEIRQQNGIAGLPTEPDIYKSALLERMRNGLEPLEHPPPLGFSCPWYAAVEDPGPHVVSFGIAFFKDAEFGQADKPQDAVRVLIFQTLYQIVERNSDDRFVIKDIRHDTPYRFKLWWQSDWQVPTEPGAGAWLMRNAALGSSG